MERDLLNPSYESQKSCHKKKRLVQAPNSYFLEVRCEGCQVNEVVYSHSQTKVHCGNCRVVLAIPTGGKCKISEGNIFRPMK
jgi:small subunit ribosomal protein S27e